MNDYFSSLIRSTSSVVMWPLLLITALVISSSARAQTERIVYDIHSVNTLDAFELFLESPEVLKNRPRLGLHPNGLVASPGEGNFTAWKFADVNEQSFALDVFFVPPVDAIDSNSGIFLLHSNPREDLSSLPEDIRGQFEWALAEAERQKREWGPGPMELNFFSYEVQLARGQSVSNDPANKRTGTFYGVPIGTQEGEQEILNQFELNPGDLYQLRILSKNGYISTFLRSVQHQSDLVPVAQMKTPQRAFDAVRGGSPISLLLQAYWNNGTSAKSFEFKSIFVKEFP